MDVFSGYATPARNGDFEATYFTLFEETFVMH